ncbi:uncharacterized protein LOC131677787 isoform X2 [Topomyia yanbarensis]|nr:uncharacterized protein LOC131677787 isoform X2 [Topomyia yanbarensis]
MQCLRNDRKIKAKRLQNRTISRNMEEWPEERHTPELLLEHPQQHDDDPLDNFENCFNGSNGIREDVELKHPIIKFSESVKQEFASEYERPLNLLQKHAVEDIDQAAETSESTENQQLQLKLKKKRTRKILLYEGHSYQLLSSRPKWDSITWGCLWRKAKDCKGTIGTKASGQILGNVLPHHNHTPEIYKGKRSKAVLIHAFREVENIYIDEPYEIVKNRIGGDVLMYGGDRYPYSHSRKDGCRIWKCGSHRNCTVSIYLCPDGRIYKLANSKHAEEKLQSKRRRTLDKNSHSFTDLSANIEEMYPNPVGTFNYKIIKNTNKRNVLIYEGDRYSFYYRKTNGWIVWRCTVSRACHAMIYQLSDESVVVLGETTHDHLKIAVSI